ncbi:50S ribosomal protein L18 [candidate division KSB1 bacterium]|nr:50S ribosomal protein L18 [candidate division KSB1 bacterium]
MKKESRQRRHKHILRQLKGTAKQPRLIVFRSNKHIYAQAVDDMRQKTLFASSTKSKEIKDEVAKASGKVAQAKLVGLHLAEVAKKKNVKKIVFDRAGYRYHGRVKALAEGAREGGLVF